MNRIKINWSKIEQGVIPETMSLQEEKEILINDICKTLNITKWTYPCQILEIKKYEDISILDFYNYIDITDNNEAMLFKLIYG